MITSTTTMSENTQKNSNSAMDQIIGNVTAEMQNLDGQYIPLAYTTPTAANIQQENMNWNQQNPYFNRACNDPHMYNSNQQFTQPSFNYIQQPSASQHLYVPNHVFNKQKNINYEIYPNFQGSASNDMYEDNFQILRNQNFQRVPHPNEQVIQSHHISNHTQLIENLVGNWVTPNNTGTYTPFGNTDLYKNNGKIFNNLDNSLGKPTTEETQFNISDHSIEDKFQFNRDTKKPRIIAEVKPMRPTYSDVLAKSVPQPSVKISKNEVKENKQKKESNKKNKSEKIVKPNVPLNRSSTNNDLNIKDIPVEKTQSSKNNDKIKVPKTGQLDRKWASLDNISEPQNKNNRFKKREDDNANQSKNISKKLKNVNVSESETNGVKNETYWISKNGVKKGNKTNNRLKNSDAVNGNERISGKRNQRVKKKDNNVVIGILRKKLKIYLTGWWKIFSVFLLWLYQVISDICSMSLHISHDVSISFWTWLCVKWAAFLTVMVALIKQFSLLNWILEKFKKTKASEKPSTSSFTQTGLKHNLPMPTTGEEAMKRLLACKGKDPYSILGVSPTCSDDDIKRYYKKQAVLVHPDKNQQPGAEEAFKILVHAFDMIGVPERRASYDRGVAESAQVEQAWSELTELLAQLQKKVEAAANTIRCSACGQRHKRVKVDRPIYAARNCSTCKIHHAAREGDIWAEAQCFGFLWHYFACMEGGVYDITDWASCQKDSLKHIKSDSHHVQYRIALGKQNNQNRKASATPRSDQPGLHDLLHTLYGQDIPYQGDMPYQADTNTKKKNKKTK